MESIEASGKSIEEAVQQALVQLGRRRDEVEIAVLQEPSRGTFGLGSKDARVRVTVRPSVGAFITPEMADAILGHADFPEDEETDIDDSVEEVEEEEEEEVFGETPEEVYDEEDDEDFEEEDVDDEDEDDEELEEYDELEEDEEEEKAPFLIPAALVPDAVANSVRPEPSADFDEEEEAPASRENIEITVDILQHILRYMNIHASVQVRSTDPLTLNIAGIHEHLGLLIGRRGETLSALQLLVNLVVRHRIKRRMRVIVDAENYRERREENLRSLAQRVAQQVRSYRRSIALEAMPPHERRIVHIALADSADISTESIGEGDTRRVVVSLKRPGR